VKHSILVSKVNEKECGGCGACVKTCLFHASKVDPVEKFAVIEQERCKGCGNCVTACPTGARDLLSYPEKYMMEAIKILSGFEVSKEPKVLAFLCEGCGYKALDLAGESGLEYPAGVLPLSIRCGGNIDTQYFLQAYKHGFDGVLVCKCSEGHCLNIVGNLDLERRANLFREILRSRGIEDNRLRIVDSLDQGKNVCVEAMNELYSSLTKSKGGHSND
jgi:coenzyme F420-reducing hydrogenase delta subunit/NAD-dependent dihydropyrimidine dehydrogenase PreA subunit